ncbi:uncharacterized protein K452DRAFT_234833 [Aplosporella prunicola CBS 121167]|uniref:Mitochondrial fission process protein 1 n=1 Tax=Aplosporella prunicola CBS 121167 TaxID=1176127 RepID=A0A6A6B444_9PEZI|nr:uncharacterized protein K452DRAFT_234833 [Aplosporella prunicola CBS 121167]KAF2137984.1 hypothetical protein K452DRAFT_234833 [Aplosporella prunicola CBS 121167]
MAKDNPADDIPRERNEPRPDFSIPPPRKPLPKALQETLDSEEKLWAAMYDGTSGESTDSPIRYAAYASRIRTILLSAHRYVAYTSDVGESFRPVAHPHLVRAAYGVSWAYLLGDVAHEGYKAYVRNQRVLHPEGPTPKLTPTTSSTGSSNSSSGAKSAAGVTARLVGKDDAVPSAAEQKSLGPSTSAQDAAHVPALEDYRSVMAQRALFQGVASMGLPALTIHSVVKHSGTYFRRHVKNARVRTWGPIGLGLAVVPFLPYIFDAPVEHAVEFVFHKGFAAIGGPGAVGARPETGRQELRQVEAKAGKEKEKEL